MKCNHIQLNTDLPTFLCLLDFGGKSAVGHLVFILTNVSTGIQVHVQSSKTNFLGCCGVEAWKKE